MNDEMSGYIGRANMVMNARVVSGKVERSFYNGKDGSRKECFIGNRAAVLARSRDEAEEMLRQLTRENKQISILIGDYTKEEVDEMARYLFFEKVWGCFYRNTPCEVVEKAISRKLDVRETIIQEMLTDDDSNVSLNLLAAYQISDDKGRAFLDWFLTSLCGWTMNTIIKKTEEEGRFYE